MKILSTILFHFDVPDSGKKTQNNICKSCLAPADVTFHVSQFKTKRPTMKMVGFFILFAYFIGIFWPIFYHIFFFFSIIYQFSVQVNLRKKETELIVMAEQKPHQISYESACWYLGSYDSVACTLFLREKHKTGCWKEKPIRRATARALCIFLCMVCSEFGR